MTKETKYGVISDLHGDPKIVPLAIEVLKKQGAEKLLVNGDICDRQERLEDSQGYTAFVLDSIGKSGLESFVQPGSHETLLGYSPVIEYFSEEYDNIFDCQRISQVSNNGHQLVFLPGSDFLCGGEYQIGNGEIPSGRYIQTKKGLMQFKEFGQYVGAIQQGITRGAVQYSNMNDIKELVKEPEKTIVVSHVPRKFNNLKNAVDVAEFGQVIIDFELNGNKIPKNSVFPLQSAEQFKKLGYPVEIKKENRGNEDLKNLYDKLGITKAVSGHFHESGHRANDSYGDKIQEGTYTDNLFWNSGCLSFGQTGILTASDNKVKYQNIDLRDYLK